VTVASVTVASVTVASVTFASVTVASVTFASVSFRGFKLKVVVQVENGGMLGITAKKMGHFTEKIICAHCK
jgi:hypothetical protein